MASTNIHDDACYINQRQEQNKGMTDYQFFLKNNLECNGNVPMKDAVPMYTTVQACPADLIATSSALQGRGTKLNACGIKCQAKDINNVQHQPTDLCLLCPEKLKLIYVNFVNSRRI